MSVPFVQSAFTTGEIAPSLYGHVDLQKYHSAAATARNCFVSFRGGLYSRAGTAYCLRSKQPYGSGAPRVINFQFNINQGFCLEFGNQYIRFFADGAPIVEAPLAISAAAIAPVLSLTITGTLAVGDWIAVAGATGMTQINGEVFVISSVLGQVVTVTDLNGTAINSTTFGAYTGGGTASRIYTLPTPYLVADLQLLKFTQSADTMSIVHPNYPPAELVRVTDSEWLLTVDTFASAIAAPPIAAVAPTTVPNPNFSPPTLPAGYAYVVTAIDSATGEESIASPIANTTTGVDIAQTAGSNIIDWIAVPGAVSYNVYRAPTSYNTNPGNPNVAAPVPAGAIFSYVGSSYGSEFVDSNITPAATKSPPLHKNPFAPGQILGVNVTAGGSGISSLTPTIVTTTGSGAVLIPVILNGVLNQVIVQNAGIGYLPTDSISFGGPGSRATGTITFAATPTAADTITLNGVVWTFVSAITGVNQTLIGSTLAATLSTLAGQLATSSNAALTVATYLANPTQLVITYATGGAGGNAYTLAASRATRSGATLTGGGAGTFPNASLEVGPLTGTYPSVVAYFQQRRVYASTFNDPDTYWMSQPGAYLNFDSSLPVTDTDSITGTPWAQQVNGIQWMIAMPGGLVVLTGLGAWQVAGSGSSAGNPQAITPVSQQATPQAFNGANNICPPFVQDYDIVYVQAKGSRVRDLAYNYWVSIYTGNDLTELSSHLFDGHTLSQVAWCQEPYKVAWYVRDDGVLLSLTYLKEQEVYGWARHDTYGQFASVCSVIEPPVDALYLVAARPVPALQTSAYFIERMDNRLWPSVEAAWCVDCGVSLPQPMPAATLFSSTAKGATVLTSNPGTFTGGSIGQVVRAAGGIATVTGFNSATSVTAIWNLPPAKVWTNTATPTMVPQPAGTWTMTAPVTVVEAPHLVGQIVTGLADGIPIPPQTVAANGAITLASPASNVVVGLPFQVQMQSVYLDVGSQPTIQGRRKNITAVTARVEFSAGFKVASNEVDGSTVSPPVLAPVWTGLQIAPNLGVPYTSPGGPQVTSLFTGDIRVNIDPNWAKPGQVAVQQDLPLPVSLTALIPEALDGDLPETTYAQAEKRDPRQIPRGPGMWMLKS